MSRMTRIAVVAIIDFLLLVASLSAAAVMSAPTTQVPAPIVGPPGQPCLPPLPAPPDIRTPIGTPPSFPVGLKPEGDPREARRFAVAVLRAAIMPPGSHTASFSGRGGPAQQPATPNLVDAVREVTVARPAAETIAFLAANTATGTVCTGSGLSGPAAFLMEQVMTLPPGIESATLLVQVGAPSADSSVVRFDAQVVFLPPRSAAETVGPAENVAVVRRTGFLPSGKTATASTTLKDPATVRRLADFVNTLPTVAPGASGCPAITVTYDLTFAPAVGAPPDFEFNAGGCGAVSVTAGGVEQPALADNGLSRGLAAFFH